MKFLATRGLSREIVDRFDRVAASSQTSCGRALLGRKRAFVDFDGREDLDGAMKMHLDAGLLSAQSTPLISRSGRFIGMFSTHWRRRHRPSDRELRFLDLLARQAADLIEQRQASAERRRLLERERAAREEAERANRIKDEFLAILSHELRSPLNPILGWVKLLQSRTFDAPTLRRALETIKRNAQLQIQLIDDLLDITRVLRGKLKLEATAVDLAGVIEAAVEVVRTAAEAKSIVLQFEAADICRVRGDAGRLQQVVWNLLSNAIKFTPEGGRVRVRLERCDRRARITVADTGQGISPDFLPYVFQFFRQEDASITRQHGGLGLGLAIVKYLADAHGGSIKAESPGEGLGATFSVEFPLLPSELDPPPAPSPSTDADLTGIKVLAVDDSEDCRELLAAVLGTCGAEIRVVASGAEVLADLGDFNPDVLICDIGMPDMDGYTLLRQIRNLPDTRRKNIPAIALTAFARAEDRRRAVELGFQQHVAKPIQLEELIGAIGQLVKG
ncbi:MAG: hybrid sensor histidine kinase/response regulator [Limnospira sp.]